jgi:hypothetical protein
MKSTPEARRRHLRWRQTAIYLTLAAGVAFVGVMAYGMWRGDLAPVLNADFKAAPSASAEVLPVPCPSSPEAVYPEPTAVVVQVLNGTGVSGLAAEAADVLASHGFPEPAPGNAPRYEGLVKLVVGVQGVDGAYTLLQFAPEGAVIVLDRREDATVDIILGAEYQSLRSEEEIALEPASAIVPLDGCRAAEDLLDELPAPAPPTAPEEGAESEAAAVLWRGPRF